MSDNESDYYVSSSEDEQGHDDEILLNKGLPKKPKQNEYNNHAKQFGIYEEDESETESDIDDSVLDDDNNEIDEDDKDNEEDESNGLSGKQIGGVGTEKEEDSDEDNGENDSDIEINEDGEPVERNNNQPKISGQKKQTTQLMIEDEDEEEDDYDENYLQKFDMELNKNYIREFHPECLNHNYDEVLKLAKVTRDENNHIIDGLHKTLPYLTKYERARVLGQRAKQIETGCKPLVKIPENIIESSVIAELELREKKIPFIIKRPIPGGAFEYWHLKDLENISF